MCDTRGGIIGGPLWLTPCKLRGSICEWHRLKKNTALAEGSSDRQQALGPHLSARRQSKTDRKWGRLLATNGINRLPAPRQTSGQRRPVSAETSHARVPVGVTTPPGSPRRRLRRLR